MNSVKANPAKVYEKICLFIIIRLLVKFVLVILFMSYLLKILPVLPLVQLSYH